MSNRESRNWMLRVKGKSFGPYTMSEIEAFVSEGKLFENDFVCHPEVTQGQWATLGSVLDFAVPPPPPPSKSELIQAEPPADEWFVTKFDGERQGPFDENAIQNAAHLGYFDSQCLVFHAKKTKGEWVAITRIPTLAAAIKSATMHGQAAIQRQTNSQLNASIARKRANSSAATTILIGGIVNMVSGVIHLLLGPFLLFTVLTGPVLFALGIFDILTSKSASELSVRRFREKAKLAGTLELCSVLIGSCLMLPIGIATLANLPPERE